MRAKLVLAGLLVLALPGCSEAPGEGLDSTVHLYVSNQSFERPVADMTVRIGGRTVFEGEAPVEDQHNWIPVETTAAAGTNVLAASESASAVTASQEFQADPDAPVWIVVEFWDPGQGGEPEITIGVSDEPVLFD